MATFHMTGTMAPNVGLFAFLYGLLAVVIASYASGALFAYFYNRLTHAVG